MRVRILAAIVGVSLLAVVAIAFPLSVRLAGDDRTQAIARLEREATAASQRVPERVTPSERITMPDLASGADLAVYNTQNQRVGGEGPTTADALVRRALTGHTAGGRRGQFLVASVPVVRHFAIVAAVRAEEPVSVVDGELRRQRLNIVLFGAAAVLIAAAVGLWLSSRLARRSRGSVTRPAVSVGAISRPARHVRESRRSTTSRRRSTTRPRGSPISSSASVRSVPTRPTSSARR